MKANDLQLAVDIAKLLRRDPELAPLYAERDRLLEVVRNQTALVYDGAEVKVC